MFVNSHKTKDVLIVSVLFALALVSRAFGLADWPLEGDEYFTVEHAAERAKSLINPLGYVLVAGSFELFGVSEWSARLPAFFIGVVTIPVFYATWRRIVGREVALVSAAIIMLSSWHLWYSQFARFYTGVFLFGSLSYFLFYQALRRHSKTYLGGALVANLVVVMFHATAVLVPAGCALFAAIVFLVPRAIDGLSRRIAGIYLAVCVVGALALSPLLCKVANGWVLSGQEWGYGPLRIALQTTKYVQVAVAIAAFAGLLSMLRREFWLGVFAACSIGVPTVFLLIASAFMSVRPDYIFYAVPMVFLLAGWLCRQVRLHTAGLGVASFTMPLVLFGSMIPEVVSHYTAKESLDLRQAVGYVERNYREGDKILSFVNGFEHYSSGDYVTEPYPGHPSDHRLDWDSALRPYTGSRRVWVIIAAKRQLPARGLQRWLSEHARLCWRRYATRYDYTVEGYEIFLANSPGGCAAVPDP